MAASLRPSSVAFDYEAAVLACARGERYALRALYERESRWLLGVALRIVGQRERAEDVLHDAFVQVWLHAASFDPSLGSARGWLYTIVRHRALREVRHPGREVTLDPQDLTHLADDAQSEADDDDRGMDAASLERCLERLEATRRACVVHAFVDGYTHEQIAQRLDAPLGTVKSWIRRGLAALKECMA
jgi:RNA polymerase sigma-70 factor, ECF subfamily